MKFRSTNNNIYPNYQVPKIKSVQTFTTINFIYLNVYHYELTHLAQRTTYIFILQNTIKTSWKLCFFAMDNYISFIYFVYIYILTTVNRKFKFLFIECKYIKFI